MNFPVIHPYPTSRNHEDVRFFSHSPSFRNVLALHVDVFTRPKEPMHDERHFLNQGVFRPPNGDPRDYIIPEYTRGERAFHAPGSWCRKQMDWHVDYLCKEDAEKKFGIKEGILAEEVLGRNCCCWGADNFYWVKNWSCGVLMSISTVGARFSCYYVSERSSPSGGVVTTPVLPVC